MNVLDDRDPKKEFNSLLTQVNREVKKMRQRCQALKEDNDRMRRQLDDLSRSGEDPFSHMTETERYVLRQQIKGLIDKIDQHLSNQI